MFDLEQAIADWRQQMLAAGIQSPAPLEELENHLREEIERRLKSGLEGQMAFEIAAQQMGQASAIKREFKKSTMKTFNWKVATLAFTALAFLDGVLLPLSFLPSFHGTLVSIAWWVFNAPGMLLAYGFQQYMRLPDSNFIFLLIGAGVISTLVWSVAGGLIIRCKKIG